MNIEIANRLVELRKSHGYSQEALAAKLGISRQAISKWERAEASPDTDNLMALAELYGTTLDALVNTENDQYILGDTPSNDAEPAQEVPAPEKLPKTELQKKGIKLLKFPFPLFVVLVFVVLGFALHIWHPAWLLFLLIPIYYHFAGALTVRKKKARLLAMPVPEVIVLLYLICGFFFYLWSTAWVLFLTIPLYYWMVGCFYKEKTPPENEL